MSILDPIRLSAVDMPAILALPMLLRSTYAMLRVESTAILCVVGHQSYSQV
jgi:hypothetical protein